MIEVSLSRNVVNIHPLIIYFILTDNEYEEYKDDVKRLNRYNSMTLGLFEYRCLCRKNAEYSNHPKRFCKALNKSNMMVRLLGDHNDESHYAFGQIDLTEESGLVVDSIRAFALDVCKRDIELLGATILSMSARGEEQENSAVKNLTAIKSGFESALKKVSCSKPSWREVSAEKMMYSRNELLPRESPISIGRRGRMDVESCDENALSSNIDSSFYKGLDKILKTEISATQSKSLLLKISRMIESDFEVTKRSSDKSAQGLMVESQREAPCISVQLIPVVRYRKQKEKYGIVVTEGEDSTPIVFSDIDQQMVYLASIVRYKAGVPLYVRELFQENKEALVHNVRFKELRKWYQRIYDVVVDKDTDGPEPWLEKVADNTKKTRSMYQAKSNANKKIELNVDYSVARYCVLDAPKDAKGNTYYTLKCPRENITLDDELQKLANDVLRISPIIS